MKLVRVIEYEGTEADIQRHLQNALMTMAVNGEVKPGKVVPGVGPIFAGVGAPQVTIRLLLERSPFSVENGAFVCGACWKFDTGGKDEGTPTLPYTCTRCDAELIEEVAVVVTYLLPREGA